MKKINEAFTCIYCKTSVEQASKTCRNHCPMCFVSLHVDGDIPGDRNTLCHGTMYPIAYEWKSDDVKILFQCTKCTKKHRNKRADDDAITQLDEKIREYKKFLISS